MNPKSDPTIREISNRTAAGSPVAPGSTIDRMLAGTVLTACLGLLAFKFVLSTRLNVNWDEFYFLNHVYSLLRGDLERVLLGGYTHLFAWLTRLPGHEIDQIVAARRVMLVLLCVTTWLVWRLARKWLSGFAALVPSFVYLSAVPVVMHGGSFRFDSMLAPLSMAALLVLWNTGSSRSRNDWLAGLLIGLALTVSMKTVLLAPLFLAAIVTRSAVASQPTSASPRAAALSATRVAIAAGLVAALLIALHSLSLAPGAAGALTDKAGGAVRHALVEVPWFPRIDFLEAYVRWQPLHWALIALGTLIALARRRFDIASLSLALLPIAFYRNAFPYYYVVMLAPSSVLAGYVVQEILEFTRRQRSKLLAPAAAVVVCTGLIYQGLAYAVRFSVDEQWNQRLVLDAVHQVFPEPVKYVDRCGMISSFPKVNFFMSTWGMQTYRARNRPFMATAIRDSQPAFVLVNSPHLNPNQPSSTGLLPEDYDLIARYYPKYWGPLRVAGASAVVGPDRPSKMTVPFPGRYRVWSRQPVLINGVEHAHGDVVEVTAEGVSVLLAPLIGDTDTRTVRLFLASARPPPEEELPSIPIFTGL